MSGATKLKLNVNANALIKTGELITNTVLLGANVYLVGSTVSNSIRTKKQDQINTNLHLGFEIASAVAGVVKVVMENGNHATNQDL